MSDQEIEWRPVKGFPNYQVSNTGLVRNIKKGGRLISVRPRGKYYQVNLWRDNQMSAAPIHRLVATAFIENPQNKPQVNHIDGYPKNNDVSNLEWATPSENNLHASKVLNRPFATSEQHGMTTLTTSQVREIKANYATGTWLQRELALFYGVSRPTISNIVNGKTWRTS